MSSGRRQRGLREAHDRDWELRREAEGVVGEEPAHLGLRVALQRRDQVRLNSNSKCVSSRSKVTIRWFKLYKLLENFWKTQKLWRSSASQGVPRRRQIRRHFHLAPPNLKFVLWPRTDIELPSNYAEFDSALDCIKQLFGSNAPGGFKRKKHVKSLNFLPGGAKFTV